MPTSYPEASFQQRYAAMSTRYWIIAVVFGLILSGHLAQAQNQTDSTEEGTAEQQSDADPLVLPNPFPVVVIESEEAAESRESREREGEEREKDDLVAQQRMAEATEAMNVATQSMKDAAWWSFGVVFFGTLLLIWTLALTRQANEAAQSAVEVTRDVGQKQSRAYVHIQKTEIFWDAARAKDRVRIIFKNFGQTSARSVMLYGARQLGRPEPFSDDAALDRGTEFSDMGPQADFTWSFDLDDPIRDEILPNGAQRQLRIIGRVDYIDAFDCKRQTNFTLKTNPTNDFINAELHLGEKGNYGT